ncbi:transposase and inactivated derivatives [Gluconobacter frateurii NBRC 103465]|nr:transposase and inactivated derivatives [Gluconobacter frateurii NBRC 103465]
MVHIRTIHAQSRRSYGRPRMTEELRARGFSAGHRRVGRLMRENDIRVVRTQRFKVTTKSAHSYAIEPNLLRQDFSATALNQNGERTSHTSGRGKAGFTWLWFWISSRAESSAGTLMSV